MITREEAKEKLFQTNDLETVDEWEDGSKEYHLSKLRVGKYFDEIFDCIDKLQEDKGNLLAEIFDMQLYIDENIKKE